MLIISISFLSTSKVTSQVSKNITLFESTVSLESIQLRTLKQISDHTYEVHIDFLRKSNQIFVEHKNQKSVIFELSEEIKALKNKNFQLTKLTEEKTEETLKYKKIVENVSTEFELSNTYNKSVISNLKKSRNRSYVIVGAVVILFVIAIN